MSYNFLYLAVDPVKSPKSIALEENSLSCGNLEYSSEPTNKSIHEKGGKSMMQHYVKGKLFQKVRSGITKPLGGKMEGWTGGVE